MKLMLSAPIPEDDKARLEALYSYNILDSVADSSLIILTKLAADICRCPIATITLVDEDKEWYFTKVGLAEEEKEAPRAVSFCGHVVCSKKIMIISDTLQDQRFEDNPFVLDDPPVRFYAGIPLINKDGYVLGTLCVIDHIPRQISQSQIRKLSMLRDLVVSNMEDNLLKTIN
jgi:GAF domain-containing protein